MTQTNDHANMEYIHRLEKIRRLSSPSLEGIADESVYSDLLRDNFTRIGALASQNREFLESVLFPLLRAHRDLTPGEARELAALGDELISAADVENLDLPIVSLISDRLLEEAEDHDDATATIRHLDMRMDTCYALMTMMGRVSAYPEIADRFRQEGLSIGRRFLDYLDRDIFAVLGEESRHTVLTDARYASVFYESARHDPDANARELRHLDHMLALSEDPYYRELTPDYDWDYFRYRTLNYYAKITDLGNSRGIAPEALEVVCERTEAFSDLWHSDPGRFGQWDDEPQVMMLLHRNRFLAGRMSAGDYRAALVELYRGRDSSRYDMNGIYENLQMPAEILCVMDPGHIGAADARLLDGIYRDMIRYAFHMPNSGSLSSMLEYCVVLIDRFIEVPGGLRFDELALQCLAALHPPTYIHSVMVARIARCLCGHLVDTQPQWLVGAPGCASIDDVRRNRDALQALAYRAGMCHDFGKLSIIDTIFVYGRNLFDMEFELIRTHPRTGYDLLARYPSTRALADVALGHHRWWDNSRGYPESFDTAKSPMKSIIDLVLCADCLDAATDSVGRSYRSGKTLDAFIEEIGPLCGTHYPPWLAGLLAGDAADEIHALLLEGRQATYRNTYGLLRHMSGYGE